LAWIAAGLLLPTGGSTQSPPDAAALPPEQELATLLVTGERPGPALWKVTWRDHTLWMLPVLSPLPRQVAWRSREVEQVLAQSQAVYTEPSLDIDLDSGGKATAAVYAALLNPGHHWLRDILPADLYAEFSAFNRSYAGNDVRLEVFRPFYAFLQLRKEALQRLHLDSDGQVHEQIARAAREHGVALHSLGREVRPRQRTLASNLARIAPQADTDCARAQMLALQREMRAAIDRANAWSVGDIAALRADWAAGRQQPQAASCGALFEQLTPTRRAIRDIRNAAYGTLQKALRGNRSTLALVLPEDVFEPDGLVARLRAAGYQVTEPDGA